MLKLRGFLSHNTTMTNHSESSTSQEQENRLFERYFTLDEAVSLLDDVRTWMVEARSILKGLQDDIVLQKRIMMVQKKSGSPPSEEQMKTLKQKFHRFEEALIEWTTFFEEKGILVKDFGKGLIDFPYYSKSLDEEFLLCWHLGEEGLFYFHELETGFRGRKPISLLPE